MQGGGGARVDTSVKGRRGLYVLAVALALAVLLIWQTRPEAPVQASSAYGISAIGASAVTPQPRVSSSGGMAAASSMSIASADGVVRGTATVSAGFGIAAAVVTNLELFDGAGVGGISIRQILVTCRDGTGSVKLTGAQLGSSVLPSAPRANTSLGDGIVQISLNTQSHNSDSTTTVVGMLVTVSGGVLSVAIGSTTCGATT